MAESMSLIFSSPVEPEQFQRLVLSLGGRMEQGEIGGARVSRADATVWVTTFPPGDLAGGARRLAALEKMLDASPLTRVTLDVSRQEDSESLAAEIVFAAAEKWDLVISNFAGDLMTVNELRARIEGGSDDLFW